MSKKRTRVTTEPEAEQVPLFDEAAEPKVKKSEWLLASELHGPGTLDKDAYLVWWIVKAGTERTQTGIVKYLHDQREWDDKRAERAVVRAIGARAIMYGEGGLLVADDCQHISRAFA